MSYPASSVSGSAGPMLCLRGQAVVRGYAIGRAVVMGAAALEVVHYRIQPEDVEAECQRLKYALVQAQGELQHMIDHLPDDAPREMGPLLTVHCMLLADRMLSEQACLLIAERLYNAEWALTTQGQTLAEQFAAIEDEYLRERGADIRQVIERVLRIAPLLGLLAQGFQSEHAGERIDRARDVSPA